MRACTARTGPWAFLLAWVFLLPGAGGPGAAAPLDQTPDRAPSLLVDEPFFDFGEVSDVAVLEHTFRFMNAGDQTLRIEDVHATCGCTTTTLARREIEGGGVETLTVRWKAEGEGREVKTITLRSNDPRHPELLLTVTATIRPFVRFQPPRLDMGLVEATVGASGGVTLTCEDPAFELIGFETPPGVTAVAQGRGPGGALSLGITVAPSKRRGLFVPKIGVRVSGLQGGERVEHLASLRLRANLYHLIACDPPLLALGKVEAGRPVAVETHLTRPEGGAFGVVAAHLEHCSVEGLSVRVVPDPEGGLRVRVEGLPKGKAGRLSGELWIETDLESEPLLRLPLLGMMP